MSHEEQQQKPTPEMELHQVLELLKRMDKRDRLRTWGGFVRSLIALVPIVFFIGSLWYFYHNGEDIMKKVADQAASAAAEYTQKQSQTFMDQLMAPKK